MISDEVELDAGTQAYLYDESVVVYWQNEESPLFLSKQDVEKMLKLFEGDEE